MTVLGDAVTTWRKVVSASGNAVAASIVDRVPTTTAPTAGDVVDGSSDVAGAVLEIAPNPPSKTYQWMTLVPFGGDANNETMLFKVYGWGEFTTSSGTLWVPVALAQATATLSSAFPGVNGSIIEDELFFADTIVKSMPASGDTGAAAAVSPATDSLTGIASLEVKVKGYKFVEVVFGLNASSASCNALYKFH